MITCKPGVVFKHLKPEIYSIFPLLDVIFSPFGCVITSASDGFHMRGSKHYTDQAIDLRSSHINAEDDKKRILGELKTRLGSDYDVLLEFPRTSNEHYHVEFDPKSV